MSDIKKEWMMHIRTIDKSISIDALTGKTLSEWMKPLVESITDDGAIPYLLGTEERYRASPLASAISWLEKANLVPMSVLTTMQKELLVLRDNNVQNDPHPGNLQKKEEDTFGWSLGEGVSVWSTGYAIDALLDSHGNGCANALKFKDSIMWLVNQRNTQGAWAYQLSENCIPNVPMTAVALRALALAYTEPNREKFQFSDSDGLSIERAIRDGFEYLKSCCVTKKNTTYWEFQDKGNCTATTWALLALRQVSMSNANSANECRDFYEKIREKARAFVCSKMPRKNTKWPEEPFVYEGGAKYSKQKNYASFSATLLPQLFELGVSAFHPRVVNQIKWLVENPEEWKIATYDKGKICYFTYAMVLSTITAWLQRVGLTLAPVLITTKRNKLPNFLYGYNSTRNANAQLVRTRNITLTYSLIFLLIIFLLFGTQIESWTEGISVHILSLWQNTKDERYDVIVGVISNILETGIGCVLIGLCAFAKKFWRIICRRFLDD